MVLMILLPSIFLVFSGMQLFENWEKDDYKKACRYAFWVGIFLCQLAYHLISIFNKNLWL